MFSEKNKPAGNKLFNCGAGSGSGYIDAYGVFSPCLLLKEQAFLYDLKKEALCKALGEIKVNTRRAITKNKDYLNKCGKCFLIQFCGQCPGRAWNEYKLLDKPVSYLCRAAHEEAIFLGLLRRGEKAWEVLNPLDRVKAMQYCGNKGV